MKLRISLASFSSCTIGKENPLMTGESHRCILHIVILLRVYNLVCFSKLCLQQEKLEALIRGEEKALAERLQGYEVIWEAALFSRALSGAHCNLTAKFAGNLLCKLHCNCQSLRIALMYSSLQLIAGPPQPVNADCN